MVSEEIKVSGICKVVSGEERVAQRDNRRDVQPIKYSKVLTSAWYMRMLPKAKERTTRKDQRAKNICCFHQPNWKTSFFTGCIEY